MFGVQLIEANFVLLIVPSWMYGQTLRSTDTSPPLEKLLSVHVVH